jgi:lia operon protein LiaG
MKIFGLESKKLALWLVIAFGAAALISGIFLLASGLPKSIRDGEDWPPVSQVDGKSFVVDEFREYPLTGLTELDIRLRFENATITPSDGDAVTVRYHGTARPSRNADKVFFAEQTANLLTLKSEWDGVSVRDGRITLDLGIPKDSNLSVTFVGGSGNLDIVELKLNELDARMGSGNIEVIDLRAGSATLKVSSGSINAEDWSVDSGSLDVVSGNLQVHDISSTGPLELNASSGNIKGNDVSASAINGRVMSGGIALKDVSGDFKMKSSSGNIDVEFLAPGNEIDINATSGRIDVGFPAGTEFLLDARATSGNIRIDFPVAVTGSMNGRSLEGMAGNGGNRTVTLKSSSGNIILKEIVQR